MISTLREWLNISGTLPHMFIILLQPGFYLDKPQDHSAVPPPYECTG